MAYSISNHLCIIFYMPLFGLAEYNIRLNEKDSIDRILIVILNLFYKLLFRMDKKAYTFMNNTIYLDGMNS
jgi:hypothetical protein